MDASRTILTDRIRATDSIVIDSSAVIAYLRGDEVVSAAAQELFDRIVASGRNPAIISSITVGEVLVGALRRHGRVPEGYKTFLLDFPGLSWRSADFLVAAEAAEIRARTKLALADAIVAATCTITSSPWLITNDTRLAKALSEFKWDTRVVLLSELALDGG